MTVNASGLATTAFRYTFQDRSGPAIVVISDRASEMLDAELCNLTLTMEPGDGAYPQMDADLGLEMRTM